MVAFFEDPFPGDYDRTGTIANAELTATNGNPGIIWAIGYGGDTGPGNVVNPDGSGAFGDEFWQAFDALDDISQLAIVLFGTSVGFFNISLSDLVENFVGVDFGETPCAPATGFGDGMCDNNGQGQILGTLGATSEYDVWDNIDIVKQSVVLVPEPAMLALTGFGLFGLGAARRRHVKG